MLPQLDLLDLDLPYQLALRAWSLLFSFLLPFLNKGGKLGKLFCTANLVDRIDFAH